MGIKITFLGTGTSQGIPVIGSTHPVCLSANPKDKRLRTSVLISWDTFNLVIDCTPDFRQQMLSNPIDTLDAILFTHEHADHTAGLDDIRPFFFKQGALPIYARKDVLKALKKRFGYILSKKNKYPGAPSVKTHRIKKTSTISLGGKSIVPIQAIHGKLKIFGFRIDDFTYLTDVKYITDSEIEKAKGSKILVINALREAPHVSHFNLEEALDFIKKVAPDKAYITHISHRLGFYEEVENNLPENIHLAYDNLSIQL